MPKFIKIDIITNENNPIIYSYETLMSFNTIEANWAFQEWWNLKGSELFNDWLKDSIGWNHLVNKLEEEQ